MKVFRLANSRLMDRDRIGNGDGIIGGVAFCSDKYSHLITRFR